jgi:DNA-binding response OmpR family regulator
VEKMPTKGLFISDHLPSIAGINSNDVIGLAISPLEEDLSFFQGIFDDAGWKLLTARTRRQAVVELNRSGIAVVICERHLIDGNWKDVLSRLVSILNPPRLIVVSRRSDDELRTEVLNMGGFDLLVAPLQEMEVAHAVGSALVDWIEEQGHGQVRWQPSRQVRTT